MTRLSQTSWDVWSQTPNSVNNWERGWEMRVSVGWGQGEVRPQIRVRKEDSFNSTFYQSRGVVLGSDT